GAELRGRLHHPRRRLDAGDQIRGASRVPEELIEPLLIRIVGRGELATRGAQLHLRSERERDGDDDERPREHTPWPGDDRVLDPRADSGEHQAGPARGFIARISRPATSRVESRRPWGVPVSAGKVAKCIGTTFLTPSSRMAYAASRGDIV